MKSQQTKNRGPMDDIECLQKASMKRSAKSKKSRSAHNNKEDNQLLVHNVVSNLLMQAGGVVENMLATLRGSKKRSQKKRPTNFSTTLNQANSYFSSLMASFTAFIQSKNEKLCCGMDTTDLDEASTCATSKMDTPSDGDYDASASVETWSEIFKSTDRDYSKSAEEVLKVISTRKTYSGNKSQRANKNYSKTPEWSSERCEC